MDGLALALTSLIAAIAQADGAPDVATLANVHFSVDGRAAAGRIVSSRVVTPAGRR